MQALIGPLKELAEFEEICKKKMDGPECSRSPAASLPRKPI